MVGGRVTGAGLTAFLSEGVALACFDETDESRDVAAFESDDESEEAFTPDFDDEEEPEDAEVLLNKARLCLGRLDTGGGLHSTEGDVRDLSVDRDDSDDFDVASDFDNNDTSELSFDVDEVDP